VVTFTNKTSARLVFYDDLFADAARNSRRITTDTAFVVTETPPISGYALSEDQNRRSGLRGIASNGNRRSWRKLSH